MAKGQAEILGIAIVVVLVVLGFLFLLRFATPGEAAVLKQRLGRAQLANNMLSAMLKTSDIACDPFKKPKIEELLIDCAENKRDDQFLGSVPCGIPPTSPTLSCQYVKEVIRDKIFQKTLEQWKLGYEFSARSGKELFVLKKSPTGRINEGCPVTMESDSQTYLLPTTLGMLEVTLKICT